MAKQIHTQEEIRKKIDSLPKSVSGFVYSSEMDAAIQQIGMKHKLHIDQMGLLETEAVDVMIGITEPSEFVSSVVETLGIDRPVAEAIAKDANEMLFEKIREAMKNGGTITQPIPPTPTASAPVVASRTPAPTSQPAAPKPQFPAADVMLSQKTSTPPVATGAAAPALPTIVPPKLAPSVAPLPAVPHAPGSMVTTPTQIQIPVKSTSSLPPSVSTPEPTPTPPAPPTAPASTTYKTDPYREPIE